ncbi:MAG: zinc ribbon domain-containing protein [Blastocatellia bacterium]|nr:zinc ribbon domain-containing protein [Blastocatellia bacterium]
MFCPTCGRDNSQERKFCAVCGTNLETVAQALSGSGDDFFTRTDMALDQLIARYSERVFKNAPSQALDRRISNSWKILGQGVVTSFVDLILYTLMWNIFPLKFLILLISTPIRALAERSTRQKSATANLDKKALDSPASLQKNWSSDFTPGATEHTTENLRDYNPTRENRAADTE